MRSEPWLRKIKLLIHLQLTLISKIYYLYDACAIFWYVVQVIKLVVFSILIMVPGYYL